MKFSFVVLALALAERSLSEKAYSKAKYTHKEDPLYVPVVSVPSGKHETTTKSCPDGFWLEGGRCVSKDEVPFTTICPAGSLDQGHECLTFSPVRFTCPAGSHLFGDECVQKLLSPKEEICPPGSFFRDGRCEVKIEEPPKCPDGTAASGMRCMRTVPVEKVCPEGYFPRVGLCARTDEAEPILECPTGFHMEGHSCFFKTSVEPVCPPGSTDEGSRCATFFPKEKKCPAGYQQAGSECVRAATAPKEIHCANGGDPAKRCEEKIPVPLSPTCPSPLKLVNGYCQSIKKSPSSFSCPEGYSFHGSTCTKVIDYDCSVTTHEVECETPAKPSKPGHGYLRRLYESFPKKDLAKAKYVHEKQSFAAPILPVCHKVPIVTPKICQRTLTAEGTPYCEEGTYRGANICETMEATPPELKCDGQTDAHGNCFVLETSAPVRTCPAGYSSGHGDVCTRKEVAEVILECPPHTEGPQCAKFQPKECPNGSCERIVSEHVTVVCPEGFVKRQAFHHSQPSAEGICTKTSFTDLVNRCPHGTEHSDLSCISFEKPVIKSETRSFLPSHVCMPGYADSGKECVKEEFSRAKPVCPDSAVYDSGRCVTSVPKTRQCPKGSVSEKGRCWTFKVAEPLTVDTVIGGHQGALWKP